MARPAGGVSMATGAGVLPPSFSFPSINHSGLELPGPKGHCGVRRAVKNSEGEYPI
jgi:hypothetical protein